MTGRKEAARDLAIHNWLVLIWTVKWRANEDKCISRTRLFDQSRVTLRDVRTALHS
jgi:hypothetical protein